MPSRVLLAVTNGGLGVPLEEFLPPGHKITAVWSIHVPLERFWYQFDIATGERRRMSLEEVQLSHLGNAFLEDYVHDWNDTGGLFRFYGRTADRGAVQHLLIECEKKY